MMTAERLSPVLRGVLRSAEPMAKHTSWRIGGPADRFYEPADLDDLALFLTRLAPEEPLYWVGLGSNLLVRDGGIRGTVICTAGVLDGYEFIDRDRVRAYAGTACAKIARVTAKAGLTGAEFLAGIPGTLGGALAMNAGAFGGETWNLVSSVETLDRYGYIRERQRREFTVGYRAVTRPVDEWFVSADLILTRDPDSAGAQRIKDLLAQRADSQPLGLPSCGSVFRNPPGDFAARLIEACGLKGCRIGGAQVSDKHANFIINLGGASAADIEDLIRHVQASVRARCGVELIAEVHAIGEVTR